MEKSQIPARGKYLESALLLILDRRRCGKLILSLENDYSKQQRNYQITFTHMYRLMVAFEPTRATPVAGGSNEGQNVGNVVTDSEPQGTGIRAVLAA